MNRSSSQHGRATRTATQDTVNDCRHLERLVKVVAGEQGSWRGDTTAKVGRNMVKTSISITTSGLTEPEVVLR